MVDDERLQSILNAMEVPDMGTPERLFLQRILGRNAALHRFDAKRFPAEKGEEQVTWLLRAVFESSNGTPALTLPVLQAVSWCLYPTWLDRGMDFLEAFDRVDLLALRAQLRELGIEDQFARVLRGRLADILDPPAPSKPIKVKSPPKVPASVTRVPATERNIATGIEMLKLRAEIKHNASFGRALRRRFEVDGREASYLMKAARSYGTRPDIYRSLSWQALLALSSPTLPAAARASLEERIRSGEKVAAHEIRAAAGVRKSGRPKQDRMPRMAANQGICWRRRERSPQRQRAARVPFPNQRAADPTA